MAPAKAGVFYWFALNSGMAALRGPIKAGPGFGPVNALMSLLIRVMVSLRFGPFF